MNLMVTYQKLRKEVWEMVYGRTEKKVMKAEYVPVKTAKGHEFTEEKKLKIWNSIVKTIEQQKPSYRS